MKFLRTFDFRTLAAAFLFSTAAAAANADIPPTPPATNKPAKPEAPVVTYPPLPPAAKSEPIDTAKYSAKIRVACVGDSITVGMGAGNGPYPRQLQGFLGDKWEVKTFAISGITLMNSGNAPFMKKPAYQAAQDYKPDVVIIMLGTNDTKPKNWEKKADFYKDYESMVKTFAALESKPRIYVCRPCPVPGNGNFGINEAGVQEQVPIIDKLAADYKLGVIDMHTALADHPGNLPDKVHPNKEGAGRMAMAAYTVLTGKKEAPLPAAGQPASPAPAPTPALAH
ncbi:MAG: GDSL-type esterase/lipase family protein [Candidatus Methylacidiphilales bacterium]